MITSLSLSFNAVNSMSFKNINHSIHIIIFVFIIILNFIDHGHGLSLLSLLTWNSSDLSKLIKTEGNSADENGTGRE